MWLSADPGGPGAGSQHQGGKGGQRDEQTLRHVAPPSSHRSEAVVVASGRRQISAPLDGAAWCRHGRTRDVVSVLRGSPSRSSVGRPSSDGHVTLKDRGWRGSPHARDRTDPWADVAVPRTPSAHRSLCSSQGGVRARCGPTRGGPTWVHISRSPRVASVRRTVTVRNPTHRVQVDTAREFLVGCRTPTNSVRCRTSADRTVRTLSGQQSRSAPAS